MATVFVGLSGGVDSAVSAALLQREGHQVVGAFIKIWQPEFIECTWARDRLDAMRVAAALRIPFREVDFSEEYKQEVVQHMIAAYARGITPNPDVVCNRAIKFGVFKDWAMREGADVVATGHYARIRHREEQYELLRGRDPQKDQSYFLHRLGQKDLASSFFPVGAYTKEKVRSLAREFDLPVARRPDSQGLCFVGDVSIPDFLSRYIELSEGDVLDTANNVIGRHRGAALYTVGQRHGFAVTTAHSSGTRAMYVIATDAEKNTVTVSGLREDAAVLSVVVDDMHWISGMGEYTHELLVQTRYRETPFPARIETKGEETVVHFVQAQVCSPGQSLVVYLPAQAGDGDMCLGGGTIRMIGSKKQ